MKRFVRRLRTVFIVLAVLSASGPASAQTPLNPILKPCLSRYDLPALSAVIVKPGTKWACSNLGYLFAGAQTQRCEAER